MKNTISIRELFFYFFFAIMFGMRMWGVYESKPLYGPLLIVGFICWIVSMLMAELSISEYIVSGLLMLLAGVVYINSGEKGLLLYFALMLGMKEIDSKKLFKVGVAAGMSGMMCRAFLSAFGVIEDVAYVQARSHVGEVFRRSLGFAHPNTLSSSFTILTMMIMYVIGNKDKVRMWKASAILMIIACYFYLYSGSRNGILITAGYLALNLFFAYRSRLTLLEKVLVVLLIPAIWLVSIIIPSTLSMETLLGIAKKDPTLVARWTIGNYYLSNNSITLFGGRLNNPDNNIYGVDPSQLYLYLQLGIGAFIIVSLLWMAILYDEVRNQKLDELVITCMLLVMGITDPFLYNIGFKNIAFAFMGTCLYRCLVRINFRRLPFLNKMFRPIVRGANSVTLPVKNVILGKSLSWRQVLIICSCSIMLLWISCDLYVDTPNPSYILADHDRGEKKDENIAKEGKTYTSEEIERFENEGNLVLNYTDDNELMYLFYTEENEKVDNGYFTPVAGKMEKIRKSVSIVFWGVWVIVIAIYLIDYFWNKGAIDERQ